AWPVAAARDAGADRVCVIVSPNRDLSEVLPDGAETVVQPDPDGTGGAARAAIDVIRDSGEVVVLPGDHPLIPPLALARLLDARPEAGAAAAVLTTAPDDPGPYGRIVRAPAGDAERIA